MHGTKLCSTVSTKYVCTRILPVLLYAAVAVGSLDSMAVSGIIHVMEFLKVTKDKV